MDLNNKEKLILHCVFHEENTPSMVCYKESKSFHCFSCGEKGLIENEEKVRLAVLRHVFNNDNIFFGTFKNLLIERCSDAYPLQVVLNSGVIIEINEMTCIKFYDDHFQIYDNQHEYVKIIYPHDKSDFSFRDIWVPYSSISFVTDAAS